MSKTIKIEIEIPAPPEGWGEVEYRRVEQGENVLFWYSRHWSLCPGQTDWAYPVARKLAPLWTPPPEWRAMFGDCWLAVDSDQEVKLSRTKPKCASGVWDSDEFWLCFNWNMIVREMLPPENIPWHKCCFKIGEPKE